MENITEGIMEFNTLVKTIFSKLCEVGCQWVREYLHTWDQIIMSRRDTDEYRCVGSRHTSIKTVMGEVSYERYYYKKRSGGYVFLLDEAMGIADGYGLISEHLAEQILLECSDKSYRKAAECISSFTGQSISRMGVWGVIQRYGERVQEQEERLKELADEGVEGQLGNVDCPALFVEGDDVWLNMQRGTRRKAGAPADRGRKRIGRRPMHVCTAYTGLRKTKDGRYSTVGKFAYAKFSKSEDFILDFEALLRQRFDVDRAERIIANGDGEAWIRTMAEKLDALLQLDPFHRSKAIMRAVKDKDSRTKINNAIKEKDAGKALDEICRMILTSSDEPSRKNLLDLYAYFDGNKDILLPWQDRVENMPEPPEGVVYRNLGLQEHNNCDIITQRMKHRKGSWSTAGANNMAKVLCLRNTIGLDAMLGAFPEPSGTGTTAEPLSAAKTPQHDGKGYDATWLYAKMPFEGVFVTEGRKAIQGLLKPRPFSERAFL